MEIEVLNSAGKAVSRVEVKSSISEGTAGEHLFYEVVKMQLAGRRRGSASTKKRSEVSGGGVKPWRQKGTGRARSGSTRSPIWRHGGIVFGPQPRDYSYQVPKRMRREALKAAMRLRLKEGRLKVYDTIELAEPKTKKAIELFKGMGIGNALVVTAGEAKNLRLAARNLKDFKVLDAGALNVYDILDHESLVMTEAALRKVEEIVAG